MFEALSLQTVDTTTVDRKIKNSGIKTAKGIFEMYKQTNEKIEMDEFSDVYSVEEIQKDKDRIAHFKKSKDYDQPTEHGIVLENLFCDLAEKHEWFGEGVKIVQLSEFDDMIASGAHCDAILEIPVGENGYVVRVGIDLTTAANFDTLNKKKTKCVEGVLSGRLFNVKYFKSKVDDTRGRIQNIPVVFAGMNKENVEALCASVAKQENTGVDALKKNEMQLMFLDEIVSQLESYTGIAQTKYGWSDGNITTWMEYYKNLFKWIKEDKKNLRPNGFGQRALLDEVYRYINKFV